MKKKCILNNYGLLWLPLLLLLTCCYAGEERSLLSGDEDVESVLTYDWSTVQDNDTTWLICAQNVVYTAENGQPQTVSFKASVKLWPEKQTISFGADKDPKPQHLSSNDASGEAGTLPTVKTVRKNFLFDDGQSVTAEIRTERFVYPKFHLPYVDISDVTFEAATAEPTDKADTYAATLVFSAIWKEQSTNASEHGAKPLFAEYTKIRSQQTDELLSTNYTQKHVWTGNNVTLFVEKTEVWSVSGTKKQEFPSPSLAFFLTAKENKAKEVENFDFTGALSSANTEMTDISSDGWTLRKGTTVKSINFTNGKDNFSDTFEYPRYTASYTLDGRKFDFDLSVTFRETHRVTVIDANNARNETTAEATLLEHVLSGVVTTALSKANNDPLPNPDPDPDPEPNPDPKPEPEYGKIISFSVTAVFDPSELHKNGNITKKCVSVRYEKGYQWGICAYEENFPASFTFTNSGYTGFNSAAMDTAQSPFQAARAEDKHDGIYWYSEDNKLLSAIDIITCKVYGWKNIVNGQYSYVINGYDANYSSDRYEMTLSAPDGSVMKFSSSADK